MKKFKVFLTFIFALAFNSAIGAGGAAVFGINPIVGVGIANGLALLPQASGVLSAKITKEIWTDDIRELFYPKLSWLNEAQDWSMWVENDKINFAEVGATPGVLKNNTSYPIPVESLGDTPRDIELEYYTTKPTHLPSAELIELAYDKRTSVVNRHKNEIYKEYAKAGAYNIAPEADGEFTPVIPTTGSANNSRKRLKFADILSLKSRFDAIEAPEDRVLVLNPTHYNDLALEDLALMKTVMDGNNLFSFRLYTYSQTPLYDLTDGSKVLEGETPAEADKTISSFAFVGSEVMRALGSIEMFLGENAPQYAGDLINFQLRALARSIRNKYVGAIYADSTT